MYENNLDQDAIDDVIEKRISSLNRDVTSNFSDLIYAYSLVIKAAASTGIQHNEISEDMGIEICAACDQLLNKNGHEKLILNIIQMKTNISKKFKIYDVLRSIISKKNDHTSYSKDTDKLTSYLKIIQTNTELCQAANKLSILLSFSRIKREMKKVYTLLQHSSTNECQPDIDNLGLFRDHKSLAAIIESDLFLFDRLQISLREIHLSFDQIEDSKTRKLYARELLYKLISLTGITLQQVNNIEENIDTGIFVILSSALKRYSINLSSGIGNIEHIFLRNKLLDNSDIPVEGGENNDFEKSYKLLTSIKQASCQVIGIDLSISLLTQTNKARISHLDTQITLNILEAITLLTNATLALNKIISQLNEKK